MSSPFTRPPRTLLGPGPSAMSPAVLGSLARPPIGYLDPELWPLLERMRTRLRACFGTSAEFTIPLTGTGMIGMESAVGNLAGPSTHVLVGVNGFFGDRIAGMFARYGATVVRFEAEWGMPLDVADAKRAAADMPRVDVLAIVHAETSTGVRNDLAPFGAFAREHDAIFLADAVTSLGGMPVAMDTVAVDVCYSATQKCLGGPSGLAPIAVSDRARNRVCSSASPSWYSDWNLLAQYFDAPHTYHHTVPISLYYALDAALGEIEAETLEARFARHENAANLLLSLLSPLDIAPFAHESARLPMLTTVRVPGWASDEAAVRGTLLNEFGIEIGGGLGHLKGRIWRIGTMGASAQPQLIEMLAAALYQCMRRSSARPSSSRPDMANL
ncbi:MAG: alanine--glyoxylate aminotransferase family protein [Armatimonadetes bacterium]|nr:alanine--glyoxylate aminotransferase family protein [Armatimonadota bacterium]MDE2205428.1 alanine--glyoxylate aminotransferase family protein [Armatimonadota bacterium]